MRRPHSKPRDMRSYTCPQCSKQRMVRELDYEVSDARQTYKTTDNAEVELFTDICDRCKRRNLKKYFEPSRADIRKVLKTMKEDAKLDDEGSLEDLL